MNIYAYKKVLHKINELEETFTCRYEEKFCLTEGGICEFCETPDDCQPEHYMTCRTLDVNNKIISRMNNLELNIKYMVKVK